MPKYHRLLNSIEAYKWIIDTSEGQHKVNVEIGTTFRQPMNLYVDSKKIATIKQSKYRLIPRFEYPFLCGEENLLLVLHGNKLDVVQNNYLINAKIEYCPKAILPWWYIIMLQFLNFFSFLLPFIMGENGALLPFEIFCGVVMIFSCAVLIVNFATSPFFSKKRKILLSFLPTIASWFVVYVLCTLNFLLDSLH